VVLDGAKIEEHATVNLSIIGSKARVARYAMINLSVLMEEAFVSRGGGFQMCLFGKQSFVAVDAVMLDLSFGKTIQVEYQGKWIDSKEYFVGVCVGHKAVVGNAVRLNYGVSIPNEALLVANADALICDASAAEPQLPYRAKDKKVARIVSTKQ
jgi:ADP-glucose pyrophosphorylase